MPILDGLSATKLIRSYEKSNPSTQLSACAAANGRIPIIAVSASLMERERSVYENAGFDAWILKPINFQRLAQLMDAIVNEEVRKSALYRPGQWEQGGWFHAGTKDVSEADTKPTGREPFTTRAALNKEGERESGKADVVATQVAAVEVSTQGPSEAA